MSHDTPPPMPVFPPLPPARKNRTNAIVVGSAAAVVVAVIATGIVVSSDNDNDGKATPAATVTVTEIAPADDDTAAADDDTEPAAKDTDDDVYSLADTVNYDNDVDVSLSGFGRGVSSDYAAPENTPYAEFTIKIVNGSGGTINADELDVNCAYGDQGKEGEAIYDDAFDGLPSTRILAGRSLSVPWACELPKGEKFLQVEVAPDYESETAIFTGNVK
jgi:hypothetical protein